MRALLKRPTMMIHMTTSTRFMKFNAFLVGVAGFTAGGLLAALMLLA
jgi:hypothetical protein